MKLVLIVMLVSSIPLEVTNCEPLCLGNEICDIDSVQDSILEDMLSCSYSSKPSDFQKIWSILSDSLSYVVENMPTCIAYTPHRGTSLKSGKQNKLCMMHQNVTLLAETIISIMVYNMD